MTRHLTHERLKEVLHYSPETGVFTWLVAFKGTWKGSIAGGARPDRYCRIGIDGRLYYAHRLAIYYCTGQWPPNVVDHINGDPGDNRIANLRCATTSQNLANKSGPRRGLPKGVNECRVGRFRASITVDRRTIHLGVFDTPNEAAEAYAAAARRFFGEFARAS